MTRFRPGFALPTAALLTVFFMAGGAATILVKPSSTPGASYAPTISIDATPAAGSTLHRSRLARTAAEAEARGLRRLVDVTLGLLAVMAAAALLGIIGLWSEQSTAAAPEVALRRAVGASKRRLRREALRDAALLALVAACFGEIGTLALRAGIGATWPGPADLGGAGLLAFSGVVILIGAAFVVAIHGSVSSVKLAVAGNLDVQPRLERAAREKRAYPMVPVLQVAAVAAALVAGIELFAASGPATRVRRSAARAAVTRMALQRTSHSEGAQDDSTPVESLLAGVGSLPGVTRASFSSPGTAFGMGTTDRVILDCGRCSTGTFYTPFKPRLVVQHFATRDTFEALGLRLVSGRTFTASDGAESQPVVIISRSLSGFRSFENGEPLGHDIRVGGDDGRWYTVVGVVDDSERGAIGGTEEPAGEIYLSALQVPTVRGDLLVVGDPDPAEVARWAREAGWSVRRTEPLSSYRAKATRPLAWFSSVWAILGLLCLLVASFGVFSTIRLEIREQIREIGLRRAVGATRRRILLSYLGLALGRTAVGLVIGLWLSLFALPHLPSLPPLDARMLRWLLEGVAIPLLFAALAGAAIPAWRAVRSPPHAAIARLSSSERPT